MGEGGDEEEVRGMAELNDATAFSPQNSSPAGALSQ